MRSLKRLAWLILILFMLLNILSAFHAYKFTHFTSGGTRTERIHLAPLKKMELIFTGVDNPRPIDAQLPAHPYQTILLKSNVKISCWNIAAQLPAKGTVILFHGYTSDKSHLIPRAEPFLQRGYNCLLVDFMGSGGSDGNSTTIGYYEAQEVKDCYSYVKSTGEKHIFLLGSSMGAVAIMKAIHDYRIKPEAIILECPFSTMYHTVCARFHMLHMPSVPMAGLIVFWGGLENGFWGFSYRPVEYAKDIQCPVLLQYGAKDDRVDREEIDDIFTNIISHKKLIVYPMAGHDDYMVKYPAEWGSNVTSFLDSMVSK